MDIPEFIHSLETRRITKCAIELRGEDFQSGMLAFNRVLNASSLRKSDLETALYWMVQKGVQFVPGFALDEHCFNAYNVSLSWLIGSNHHAIDDHMKGLYIMGGTGSGKTTLVRLLRIMAYGLGVERPFFDTGSGEYLYKPMLWSCDQHAIATAQHYAETGEYQGLHNRILHIGDLGAEPEETLHWGTRTKPLSDLICQRSDQGYYDAPMIITSNYHPEDLRPRYGDRCVSRLLGDFILIEMGGRDRRTDE